MKKSKRFVFQFSLFFVGSVCVTREGLTRFLNRAVHRAHHTHSIHHLVVAVGHARGGVAPDLDALTDAVVPDVREAARLMRDRVENRTVLSDDHRDVVRVLELQHPKVAAGRWVVDLRHTAVGPLNTTGHPTLCRRRHFTTEAVARDEHGSLCGEHC